MVPVMSLDSRAVLREGVSGDEEKTRLCQSRTFQGRPTEPKFVFV